MSHKEEAEVADEHGGDEEHGESEVSEAEHAEEEEYDSDQFVMHDPLQEELEEKCKSGCTAQNRVYEDCVKRISTASGHGNEQPHCIPQYLLYHQCLDKCVLPQLWQRLK